MLGFEMLFRAKPQDLKGVDTRTTPNKNRVYVSENIQTGKEVSHFLSFVPIGRTLKYLEMYLRRFSIKIFQSFVFVQTLREITIYRSPAVLNGPQFDNNG
jgi:hypothetical protein